MKPITIREYGQWVKITRSADKSFTLARGYDGEFKAHDITKYSAKYLPTWKDAGDLARLRIDSYK